MVWPVYGWLQPRRTCWAWWN
ncbi:MAG: hypothetical protein RLZZ616_2172, partial [Pseudomonadota bacterium]